ncbi:hypothetical protein [Streptomyces sp. NPDC020983]|uniref:hypothetical protein n=1 Tax=Streptomyces sp. NPDC020983 TaxID=3365106 RepID=UPI0037B1D239
MLLTPENTLFVRGRTPVLLLAGASVHGALPVVGREIPRPAGWSVLPRLTMCVVDGPGEHGLVIPAAAAPVLPSADDSAYREGHGDGGAGMDGWCADAEAAGGVLVLSLPQLPAEPDLAALTAAGSARGGFLPLAG